MVCDFHSYDLFFLVYLNPVCCSSIDIDFLSLLDRLLQILQNLFKKIYISMCIHIFQALGFGQTRGRLYIKHPELFKYSGDQTDKEWLAKANLMATTGGKAYLMVLQDILDLVESPEYSSHPKQQPG